MDLLGVLMPIDLHIVYAARLFNETFPLRGYGSLAQIRIDSACDGIDIFILEIVPTLHS